MTDNRRPWYRQRLPANNSGDPSPCTRSARGWQQCAPSLEPCVPDSAKAAVFLLQMQQQTAHHAQRSTLTLCSVFSTVCCLFCLHLKDTFFLKGTRDAVVLYRTSAMRIYSRCCIDAVIGGWCITVRAWACSSNGHANINLREANQKTQMRCTLLM